MICWALSWRIKQHHTWGALSRLTNSEINNHRRQPMIGALLLQWSGWLAHEWAITWKERRRPLDSKRRHPTTMENQREGTCISNQVRMHACYLTSKHCTHIFYSLQENPQRSPEKLKKTNQEKKIIKHNNRESWSWPWNGKKIEINLTVRKISKKWEGQSCHHKESSGQPCNQEAPSFPTLSSRKI
jgi:hypothetical protein